MRAFSTLALAGCTWLALGATAFADVQISIHDGRVSLAAKNATVRQILTEWARVGRTTIVNVERISGGPLTIELSNVPEQDALDLLLRSVSGYMAAPRAPFISSASQFDRIIVLPTSVAPRPAASAAPPPFAQTNGLLLQQPPDEDDNPRQPGGLPSGVGPIFSSFPQVPSTPRRPIAPPTTPGIFGAPPQQADPQVGQQGPAALTPSAQPAAPFGAVSAPGMIAPAPAQQPGQVIPQGLQPRRTNEN